MVGEMKDAFKGSEPNDEKTGAEGQDHPMDYEKK